MRSKINDMNKNTWFDSAKILPDNKIVVETKIDDGKTACNEQDLKRINNLWFHPDGGMYVYYQPTHWRYKS